MHFVYEPISNEGRVPSNEFQSMECNGPYPGINGRQTITFDHNSLNCNQLCGIACMLGRIGQSHRENMLRAGLSKK